MCMHAEASRAPPSRLSGANALYNPVVARDDRGAPSRCRARRLHPGCRERLAPLGGSGQPRQRERGEESEAKKRSQEEAKGKEPGSKGGAGRGAAAAGRDSDGPAANGRRAADRRVGGGWGQVRDPPTAAGRWPARGRGVRHSTPAARQPPSPMVLRRELAPARRLREGAAEPAGSGAWLA